MRRTGLSYDDILALVKTPFVNPVQSEPFPPETVVLFSPRGRLRPEPNVDSAPQQ